MPPYLHVNYVAYWCERPDLFAEIADGKTEEDRAIRVLKWFIVRRFLTSTPLNPDDADCSC